MGARLVFNGIDVATGDDLVPAIDADELSPATFGFEQDSDHLAELRWRGGLRGHDSGSR